MKLYWFEPSDKDMQAAIAEQIGTAFTYPEPGCTAREEAPSGYRVSDATRLLGAGDACWLIAKAKLRAWHQFCLGWTKTFPPMAALEADTVVAVRARTVGVWTINCCRIVYTIDEPNRFGFAYGTLPRHAERGEELFLLTRLSDGTVAFRILAYSQPNDLLVWAFHGVGVHYQNQFRDEALAKMANDA